MQTTSQQRCRTNEQDGNDTVSLCYPSNVIPQERGSGKKDATANQQDKTHKSAQQ
jgi:hypothetical protein